MYGSITLYALAALGAHSPCIDYTVPIGMHWLHLEPTHPSTTLYALATLGAHSPCGSTVLPLLIAHSPCLGIALRSSDGCDPGRAQSYRCYSQQQGPHVSSPSWQSLRLVVGFQVEKVTAVSQSKSSNV
jgi:hypothetical protein